MDYYFSSPVEADDNNAEQLRGFIPGGLRAPAVLGAASPVLRQSSYGRADYRDASKLGTADPLLSMNTSGPDFGAGGPGGGSGAPAGTTMSIMSPIFHFTSHDTTIVAMEHNNHSKLLALSTSKNEVFVTLTQVMPVVEDPFAVLQQGGPTLDERLQDWDPAAMTVLVDRLPAPCTQLRWAPWQHGVYLAAICPGKEVRIYRYSHGRWALDAAVTDPADCLTLAFSAQFTLACGCRHGRVVLLTRSPVAGEKTGWVASHTYVPPPHGTKPGKGEPQSTAGSSDVPRAADCVSVEFDESGSLLAVVDKAAYVKVHTVSHECTRFGPVAFARGEAWGRRSLGQGFRQVTWSPLAGRSFLALAVVLPGRVHLLAFRRPRHLSAAGMPLNAGGGAGGAHRGSGNAAALAQSSGQTPLQLLAECTALCEEVAKLTWNTTGTRFVTSHSDSTVHVWALDITYQQAQPAPLATLLEGSSDSGNRDSTGVGAPLLATPAASAGSTKGGVVRPNSKLSLAVTIRKVSSVYPYHALNTK